MWTLHTDSGNNIYGGQSAKNIYLGETRIVTKLNSGENPTYQEEYYKQYYYHSDHLGSASLISDYKGDEYQRIEYTPYGETWVEKTNNTGLEYLPYKFTAKELDEETGLYYYGARYLDPKYSRWLSTDSALGEYIPQAPVNDEAKRHNQNLPGLGGVFNIVNLNLYHYAASNPVKYIDPEGKKIINTYIDIFMDNSSNILGTQPLRNESAPKFLRINDYGCVLTSLARIASSLYSHKINLNDFNDYAISNNLFTLDTSDEMGDVTILTAEAGEKLINGYLSDKLDCSSFAVKYVGTFKDLSMLNDFDNDDCQYYVTARIEGKHTVSLDSFFYNSKNIKGFKLKDTHKEKYKCYDYSNITSFTVYKIQRRNNQNEYEDLH